MRIARPSTQHTHQGDESVRSLGISEACFGFVQTRIAQVQEVGGRKHLGYLGWRAGIVCSVNVWEVSILETAFHQGFQYGQQERSVLGVYILNSLHGPHRSCGPLSAFCPMPSFRLLGQRVSLNYNP